MYLSPVFSVACTLASCMRQAHAKKKEIWLDTCVSSPQEEEEAASQAILKAGQIDVIIHSQRCKRQICPAHQQGAYVVPTQLKMEAGRKAVHIEGLDAKELKGQTYRST